MMRLRYPVLLGALLETRIFRQSRRSSAASSLGVSPLNLYARLVHWLCWMWAASYRVRPFKLIDMGDVVQCAAKLRTRHRAGCLVIRKRLRTESIESYSLAIGKENIEFWCSGNRKY